MSGFFQGNGKGPNILSGGEGEGSFPSVVGRPLFALNEGKDKGGHRTVFGGGHEHKSLLLAGWGRSLFGGWGEGR